MTTNPRILQARAQAQAQAQAAQPTNHTNQPYQPRGFGGIVRDYVIKPALVIGAIATGALAYEAYQHPNSSFLSRMFGRTSGLEQTVTKSLPAVSDSSSRKASRDISVADVPVVPQFVPPVESTVSTYSSDTTDIDGGGGTIEERVYTPTVPAKPSQTSSVKKTFSTSSNTPSGFYFSNTFRFHNELYTLVRKGLEEELQTKFGISECQNFTLRHGQGLLDSRTEVPYWNILNYHNRNNRDQIRQLSDIVLEFTGDKGKLLPSLVPSNGRSGIVLFYNMGSGIRSITDGNLFNRFDNYNVNNLGIEITPASQESYTLGYDPNLYAVVALEFAPDSRFTTNGSELGGRVTNMTVRRAKIPSLKSHKALAFGTGLVLGNVFPAGTTYVNAAALFSTVVGLGNNRSTPDSNRDITSVDAAVLHALAQNQVSPQNLNTLSGVFSRHAGPVLNCDWSNGTFSSSDFSAMANTIIPVRAGNSERITVNNGNYIGKVSVILVREGESTVVLEPGWLRKLGDSSNETDFSTADVNDKRYFYTFREYPKVPGSLVEQRNIFDNKWNIHYRPFSYDHNILKIIAVVNSYSPQSVNCSGKEVIESSSGKEVIGSYSGKKVIGSTSGRSGKEVIEVYQSETTPSNTYFIQIGEREIERDPKLLTYFAIGYNFHPRDHPHDYHSKKTKTPPDNPPEKITRAPGRRGGEVNKVPSRGNGTDGIPGRGSGPVDGPPSNSTTYNP